MHRAFSLFYGTIIEKILSISKLSSQEKKLGDALSIEKKIEKNVFFKGNRFSSKLGGSRIRYDPKKGLSRMAAATIEGLAFLSCPSRGPDEVGRRGCLSEALRGAQRRSNPINK
jgi:hypothetical protein